MLSRFNFPDYMIILHAMKKLVRRILWIILIALILIVTWFASPDE